MKAGKFIFHGAAFFSVALLTRRAALGGATFAKLCGAARRAFGGAVVLNRSGRSWKITTMVIAENRHPHKSITYIIAHNKDYMTVV